MTLPPQNKPISIGKFFIAYSAFALLASPFYWFFSDYSYEGYLYNLEKSLIWPSTLFEERTVINSSSISKYNKSLDIIDRKHSDSDSKAIAYETINYYLIYEWALHDKGFMESELKNINLKEVKRNLEAKSLYPDFFQKIHGLDMSDLIEKNHEVKTRLAMLVNERKRIIATELENKKTLKTISSEIDTRVMSQSQENISQPQEIPENTETSNPNSDQSENR